MPLILLETRIEAPIERCFDLARDIDLHIRSTAHTREVAIAGVTKGLIDFGDEVTWEATHFGIRRRLTSRITAFDRPNHFRDSQVRGAFRRFDHDHRFETTSEGVTMMRDEFDYESPLGWLGTIANRLFLEAYMRNFLQERNLLIQKVA
jgi:ligand-binding SRPBCC domain-containing protein